MNVSVTQLKGVLYRRKNVHGIKGCLPIESSVRPHIERNNLGFFLRLKQNRTSNNFSCSVNFTFMELTLVKSPQQRFILYWHTRLHNCKKDTFFFIYIFFFFTEIVKFHLAASPPLLLLAICEVQHRVLPQAVPFVRSKCCLMTNDFLS